MSKFEYRHSKQIRMTEIQSSQCATVRVLNIRILGFVLVSDFGFRISDFRL